MDEYVPEDEQFGDEAPYNVDPNDFVKYISKAAYVCTDSFHCTVFSILFNRQFMTFYRFATSNKTGRNSRIDSLFNILGLQERLYKGNITNITHPINYDSVEKNLMGLRKNSIAFLNDSLS